MSYGAFHLQAKLFICISFPILAGQIGNLSHPLKVLVNKPMTPEWIPIHSSKDSCKTENVVVPQLDLHVANGIMTAKIKVFQPLLDDTIFIMRDNVTIDVTRYDNNSCYNINGKCTKTICSCNINNNTLTSLYRINVTSLMNCSSFGIEYRFHGNQIAIIKCYSFKNFDGSYFSGLFTQLSAVKCFAEITNEHKFACFSIMSLSCLGIMTLVYVMVRFACSWVKKRGNAPKTDCYADTNPTILPVNVNKSKKLKSLTKQSKRKRKRRKVISPNGGHRSTYSRRTGDEKDQVSLSISDEYNCNLRLIEEVVQHHETPIHKTITHESCDKENVSQDDLKQIVPDKKVLQPRGDDEISMYEDKIG